jgi:hypothetical protein
LARGTLPTMLNGRRYHAWIAQGLGRAFETAEEHVLGEDERLVLFSDHHKGVGDSRDVFGPCESAYADALEHYLEEGYSLLVLGDADELWWNHPTAVLRHHRHILELEAQFYERGRYKRLFGEHDHLWADEGQVRSHLEDLFPGLWVREAIRLRLERPRDADAVLFLVHGHQGKHQVERSSSPSRLFLRYPLGAFQRRFENTWTSPSRDSHLRQLHNTAMFDWARTRKEKIILIAGHTHEPSFSGWTPAPNTRRRPASVLEFELRRAVRSGLDAGSIAALRAELEYARSREGIEAFTSGPPCYFNTGSCSFGDGDITGLEIADGEIRLVRWPDDDGGPRARVLAAENLSALVEALA